MRLSSIITAIAGTGAVSATVIKGPFEIQAVAINDTKTWATNIGVVSRGAVILSLATGSPAKFTWSDDSRLIPVGEDSSLHGSIGDVGNTLLFVGKDGPQPPGPVDGALRQYQTDAGTFIIPDGADGNQFQWNTLFSAENLPRGFGRAAPGSQEANAALVIRE